MISLIMLRKSRKKKKKDKLDGADEKNGTFDRDGVEQRQMQLDKEEYACVN